MVSVIVPFYGHDELRVEALKKVILYLLMQDFKEEKEVILVVQQSDGVMKVSNGVRNLLLPKTESRYFNKSWCINAGVNQSRGNTIVVIDADMIFGNDYIRLINYYMKQDSIPSGYPFFIGWSYMVCLPGRDNSIPRCVTPNYTLTAGGVFVTTRDFFFRVGMMNENYEGYGGEDNDLYYRAQELRGSKLIWQMPYALAHSYHDWAEPDESREFILEKTRQHPMETIKILNKHKDSMGNLKYPVIVPVFAGKEDK